MKTCIQSGEEEETLNISFCSALGGKNCEYEALHKPRIEEPDEVLGEFLFRGQECNTKKETATKDNVE